MLKLFGIVSAVFHQKNVNSWNQRGEAHARKLYCCSFMYKLDLTMSIGDTTFFFSVLRYQPPGKNGSFLAKFGDFLASIIHYERILILGDFNIHVNKSMDSLAVVFLNVTDSFSFIQHVSGPAHIKGDTLDLVFTMGLKVNNVCAEDFLLSDHKGVTFILAFDKNFIREICEVLSNYQ